MLDNSTAGIIFAGESHKNCVRILSNERYDKSTLKKLVVDKIFKM